MKTAPSKFLTRRYLLVTVFLAASAAILWYVKSTGLYVDIELLVVGEQAPSFRADRLDDRRQSLSEMHGSVVWIIFGRTDDDRTKIQLKEAEGVAEYFKEWDLRILFMSQSQSKTDLEKYVAENGCPAAVMLDKGNRVADKYHVDYYPTSYLVDKTGFIRWVHRGVVRADDPRFLNTIGEQLRSGMRNAPKMQ